MRDLAAALREGWRAFRTMPSPSAAFAAVFAVIGAAILATLGVLGLSPMVLPLAGGFMLIGPVLLVGFFELFRIYASGEQPRVRHALVGFTRAPAGLWLVAAVCAVLFLIWITDAGVLYSFMVGSEHLPYELPWLIRLQERVVAFELWASLMGSALAFIIFAVSAFSVPLLYERRADVVGAVHASVRAVFGNLAAAVVWGILLTATILVAILLLPLLLVVFPVLAYASFVLYRQVFPVVLPSEAGGD